MLLIFITDDWKETEDTSIYSKTIKEYKRLYEITNILTSVAIKDLKTFP